MHGCAIYKVEYVQQQKMYIHVYKHKDLAMIGFGDYTWNHWLKFSLTCNIFFNVIHCSFTEKNAVNALDFSDEIEWDTKTLASAVKAYFGWVYF